MPYVLLLVERKKTFIMMSIPHPLPLDAKRRDFIRALPKAEQHLHLEGAVPWATMQATDPDNLPLEPAWLAHDYVFPSFEEFSALFKPCTSVLMATAEGYAQAARTYFTHLQSQNVRYIALSFAALHAFHHGLDLVDVVQGILDSAPEDLTVDVYLAFGQTVGMYTPAQIEAMLGAPNIAGIDKHGNERLAEIETFADIFAEAEKRGLRTKAHAGELRGASAVQRTLDSLGVKRLQHGIRALEDESLMQRLADEKIVLDMCPTSNIKLGVWDDWATYPLREFMQRGIPVTINTDDPTFFNITLTDELERVAYFMDLSFEEIAQLQRTAFMHAHLPDDVRDSILAEIDALVGEYT
jgi:adenosine deaminase